MKSALWTSALHVLWAALMLVAAVLYWLDDKPLLAAMYAATTGAVGYASVLWYQTARIRGEEARP